MKKQNLIGARFGKWLVISDAPSSKSRHTMWRCRCECGCESFVHSVHLKSGASRGCFNCGVVKHGGSGSPEHESWSSMKLRCLNKNHIAYHRYGGRGIDICDRWNDFAEFLKDMGSRPAGCSLDRIDNNKGYYPDNCKWSSKREQANNTMQNVNVEYKGSKYTISELSDFLGINYRTLYSRLQRGTQLDATVRAKKPL